MTTTASLHSAQQKAGQTVGITLQRKVADGDLLAEKGAKPKVERKTLGWTTLFLVRRWAREWHGRCIECAASRERTGHVLPDGSNMARKPTSQSGLCSKSSQTVTESEIIHSRTIRCGQRIMSASMET